MKVKYTIMFYYKNTKMFLFLLGFVFAVLFPLSSVFAAQIFSTPENVEARVGDEFEVSWFLNTEGEAVNAVQGKILYLPSQMNVSEMRLGGSLISFWIERPRADEKSGSIVFSGIMPGGFIGEKAPLFSVVFTARNEGEKTLAYRDVLALLNDGKGTSLPTSISETRILVRGDAGKIPRKAPSGLYDIFMPESFTPFIEKNMPLFRGRYALFFSTRDADSGIAYYEVCEGRLPCVRVESPYALKNQRLTDEIAVKAYDTNGNRRIAMIPPSAQKKMYGFGPFTFELSFPFMVILIGLISSGVIFFMHRPSKKL